MIRTDKPFFIATPIDIFVNSRFQSSASPARAAMYKDSSGGFINASADFA
jgi:hypothetical protein